MPTRARRAAQSPEPFPIALTDLLTIFQMAAGLLDLLGLEWPWDPDVYDRLPAKVRAALPPLPKWKAGEWRPLIVDARYNPEILSNVTKLVASLQSYADRAAVLTVDDPIRAATEDLFAAVISRPGERPVDRFEARRILHAWWASPMRQVLPVDFTAQREALLEALGKVILAVGERINPAPAGRDQALAIESPPVWDRLALSMEDRLARLDGAIYRLSSPNEAGLLRSLKQAAGGGVSASAIRNLLGEDAARIFRRIARNAPALAEHIARPLGRGSRIGYSLK